MTTCASAPTGKVSTLPATTGVSGVDEAATYDRPGASVVVTSLAVVPKKSDCSTICVTVIVAPGSGATVLIVSRTSTAWPRSTACPVTGVGSTAAERLSCGATVMGVRVVGLMAGVPPVRFCEMKPRTRMVRSTPAAPAMLAYVTVTVPPGAEAGATGTLVTTPPPLAVAETSWNASGRVMTALAVTMEVPTIASTS